MPVAVGQGAELKCSILMKPLSRLKLRNYGRPLAALLGETLPAPPPSLTLLKGSQGHPNK